MIYGIGTDIVELARIAAVREKYGVRFVERILGPHELARYHARNERAPARGLAFLATRFAAKEAISKALGLGMRMPMTWRAVQIINAPGGKPVARAEGALAAFMQAQRLRLHVSVTDERSHAMAYAVAEVVDGED